MNRLCDAAYGSASASYFESIGPGEHLLGRRDGVLVSHLMWVAALCPATEGLYARLGWRFWRGPLRVRKDGRLLATPEERVMILPLAGTPPLDLDAPLSVEWRPGEVW